MSDNRRKYITITALRTVEMSGFMLSQLPNLELFIDTVYRYFYLGIGLAY
jgi:hypothetical protein